MSEWHDSKEWKRARAYAKTILEPICATCSKHLYGNDWTIDHIQVSDPPNHNIDNLQSMCRKCNGTKGDRMPQRTNWRNHKWQ